MNFVTIDFETSNYTKLSAISVGLAKFRDKQVVDTFYTLINPVESLFLQDLTKIHGLTYDMVKDSPTFSEISDKLIDFIQDDTLIAHNAGFDMSILKAHFDYCNIKCDYFKYVCSLQIARRCFTNTKSYKLVDLASHFGINYNAHNALDDAITCGKIVNIANKDNEKNLLDFLKKNNLKYKYLGAFDEKN